MYNKNDLVMLKSEFIYQVHIIKKVEKNYYTTCFVEQGRSGFKLKVWKEHVIRKEKLDSDDYILLENHERFFEWAIDWCMTNFDYPGYIEFK